MAMASETVSTKISFSRRENLLRELTYAWERSPSDSLATWTTDTVSMFGTVIVRRVANVATLVSNVGKDIIEEVQDAIDAYRYDNLGSHLINRGYAVKQGTVNASSSAYDQLLDMKSALQNNPKEKAPELIVCVLAFIAASGGPDGDGGIPDLDLVMGIGAHRSIVTHSIISGAVVETGLYSVATLIGIVHKNLPRKHDPLWDALHQNKDKYLGAVSKGASAGIAYHLFVDGTFQPAAYHDLPISMPIEGHQAILDINAVAEARDVSAKDETFSTSYARTASTAKQEHSAETESEAVDMIVFATKIESENKQRNLLASFLIIDHHTYRRRRMDIPESVARQLHPAHNELLRKYGHWMHALSCGVLFPLTDEQRSFVKFARGEAAAKSDLEHAWLAFSQLTK